MRTEITDIINAVLDGEATPEQEALLKEYMKRDGQCRRVYDALRGISEAMPEGLVEPPHELASGVMEKIGAQNAGAKKKSTPHLWRYLAAAACFTLVIFGAWQLGLFGSLGGSKSSVDEASLEYKLGVAPMEDSSLNGDAFGKAPEAYDDGANNAPAAANEGDAQSNINASPFSEQVGLLNRAFSSNARFVQNELDRLSTAKAIALYDGEYILGDAQYKDAVPLVPAFDEAAKTRLFKLMTADILLNYDEETAGQLETFCTILFTGVQSEDGQTREDLTVTVWIYDGLLYFKISSQPPILCLSDTFPIDFEEAVRQLTIVN